MRDEVLAVVRRQLGPAVRRARREAQWRHARVRRLPVEPAEGFEHLVAEHATPLIRQLAGVDEALQRGKVVNLRLAAARLDSRVLGPGQRFSFWRQVDRPTAARGFVDGLVLDHGRLTAGTGGGLCQATNLLYWLTLHTPLDVAERWRHSYDVFPDADRTQPFGSGATCAWPSLDLQLVNRTSTRFRLTVTVTDTHLVGSWHADRPVPWRYQVYEDRHAVAPRPDGSFVRRNVLRRRTLDEHGALVCDELVTVNEALMRYRPLLTGPERPGDAAAG